MQAELILGITRRGFGDGPWLVATCVAFLLALAVWWWQRRLRRPANLHAFFIAMGAVAVLAVSATSWNQQRLAGKLQAGQVQMAEGPVQAYALQHTAVYNSSSQRYDRSTWESFRIGGAAFIYRRGGGGAGFQNAGEPPLDITDGQRMRLHFVEDVEDDRSERRILRIDLLPAAARLASKG